jgi:predicted amidohydrolase
MSQNTTIKESHMALNARLTSISFSGVRENLAPVDTVKRNVEELCRRIDDAATDKPDLIVMPETCNALGMDSGKWLTTPETIPGPTTDTFAAKARQYRTHIVVPILEIRDGTRYNAAALIDRDGQIVGVYHKMFPTVPELDGGVKPGTEAPAWDTDIGRIGCAICFDLNFREVFDSLKAYDADIVAFASMYRGGLSTKIWAFDGGWWFISSTPGENSVIRNPLGQLIKQSYAYSPTFTAHVNLDTEVLHIDFNQSKLKAMKEKYGPDAEVHSISPEAIFMLTSHHSDVTVKDMIREFSFETREEYWVRSHAKRAEVLKA